MKRASIAIYVFVAVVVTLKAESARADDPISVDVSAAGSHAISGKNTSNAANSLGLTGHAAGTGKNIGVLGKSDGAAADAAGVVGQASGTTSANAGVIGTTASQKKGAAGVKGVDGTGASPTRLPNQWLSAGVFGDSKDNHGVLGVSAWNGVRGSLVDAMGTEIASGSSGFWSMKDSKAFAFWGLGTIATIGKKDFVEPHPTDPAKAIYYVCTESNESMVEVRGRGQTTDGIATIPLPPSFAIVASPDSDRLTAQVTPIGVLTPISVKQMTPNFIVVQSEVDTPFSWHVQSTRAAYGDHQDIDDQGVFVPESPSSQLPAALPPLLQNRLIANGTYNPDGTVNLDTARQQGWDQLWHGESPSLQPGRP